MEQNFSLFPLERVAGHWYGTDQGDFDDSQLPFEIVKDVHVENVSALIRKSEFDYLQSNLGSDTVKFLRNISYAIIHRFPNIEVNPSTGTYKLEQELTQESSELVQKITACLRLIRPTTQHAQFMGGRIDSKGKLRHFHFDNPLIYVNSLPNQKLFSVRTSDLRDLRFYAPRFIQAFDDKRWKFIMAIDMFQSSFFQHSYWKVRFFLLTAALEALFTSHTSDQHRGSIVAKARIKNLLGSKKLIYPKGELTQYETDPNHTIEDVIDEIYCLRNHLAHGDRVPDYYLQTPGRMGVNGAYYKGETLTEAANSIVRQCLLKILKDGLLPHFADDMTASTYFSSLGLTRNLLRKAQKAPKITPFKCPT
jgi:hypothetical protein